MDLVIRHVAEGDVEAVHEILTSFAIEGTMPRTGFGDGGWMDAHVMGRLRDP